MTCCGSSLDASEQFLLARWGRVEFRDCGDRFHVHLSGEFPKLCGGRSFSATSREMVLDAAVAYTAGRVREILSIQDAEGWLLRHAQGTAEGRDLLRREGNRLAELLEGMRIAGVAKGDKP